MKTRGRRANNGNSGRSKSPSTITDTATANTTSLKERRKSAKTLVKVPVRVNSIESMATDDGDDEGDETGYEESETEATTLASSPSLLVTPQSKHEQMNKIITRSLTAVIMCFFFIGIIKLGHFYCILSCLLVQIELYRELVNVRYVEAKERKMPLFRTLQWAWFIATMMFSYGEELNKFCSNHKNVCPIYMISDSIHKYSFLLYCALFIATVGTFRIKLVKFQVSQFAWSILIVLVLVFQSHSLVTNILNGLFWFFFPFATVVMNDVSAYFCGITFGKKYIKRPFFTLSPSKTWEGFIGALILTVIFSFFFPVLLSQYTFITCPANDVSLWPSVLQCNVNPVFLSKVYSIRLPYMNESIELDLLPIQIHGLCFGLFASLVAPWGGFFASAIKRAYNKKDFESFIPGHGGMVDRMDCQLIMLAFTSYYYATFINPLPHLSNLVFYASQLSPLQRAQLIKDIQNL